ncbi:MAG: hypothetical protein HOF74_04475 [Gammaproteobacteria bacterium]|nr:hypothetical protein [Gammaproteobacteria bacterium]MBT3859063.1 hypothetical protein [Gammaproteobacteria bacterium]MBT3987063.1 hypothetical protein [Gammaproteobacteria bacterium]MBT4257170.1 hypothetical protein [Gammaproteobacteria bacterium]MBT4580672.1 hypothetical protein [Gammaproteobacteria bacterium]
MVKRKVVLSLHRRIGITSALFVVLLSFTGILLQHISSFGLDSSFISSERLLAWYGIEIPEIESSYNSETNTVSLIEDALFFNGSALSGNYSSLAGLVNTEFGSVVATGNQLILISEEGELIEVLGSVHGVPGEIISIGLGLDTLSLDTTGLNTTGLETTEVSVNSTVPIILRLSNRLVEADLDALAWVDAELDSAGVRWSEAAELSASEAESIKQRYGASLLSWERIVLDIHSGRVFGQFGVFLVDLMAILFLFMAITGVWIWSRRRSKIKNHS